jgi:NAD+ diphosphatase
MPTFRYCPQCATPLMDIMVPDDGGERLRLSCPSCDYVHWNNPTPVLAAVIELQDRDGQLLLARNAAWQPGMFGLITGFMEAGESPTDGIRREVKEETTLSVSSLDLVGVYDFQRMNQVIIAYHALAHGEIKLSPELVEYQTVSKTEVKCARRGTGLAIADFLRSQGIEPQWKE